MRNIQKHGLMVAAVALMVATSGVAQAADVDLQSLQQQINQLQQQLKDLQAKQAAAPAAAAATPTKSPYDVLMTNPARGAFVIPGTNTTLHVGGFIDLSTTYDVNSSIGPAGYAQLAGFNKTSYSPNALTNLNNGNIALPGTPYARATGRFQMDPRFSRLNVETDTPSEWGVIGTVLEMDFDGDGLTANQKSTYSVSPRLRRAFVTFGNWTIGQTQQLTYDGPTNPQSIDNNSFMGQESGNRFPQIQYRYNIDAAQKHQLYASIESPYSDYVGAVASNFQAGGQMAYQTNSVNHYPDLNVKYVENGSWGRFFAAANLHDIEANSDGTSFTGGSVTVANGVRTDKWFAGVDGGAKIYTFGDPRSNINLNAEYFQAGARYANYSGGNSAIIGPDGKLHAQPTMGFAVGYNNWFNDHWQANLNYGLQHQWNRLAWQNNQALWKEGQELEANVFWMPTTYVNFGLAYIFAKENAVQGACLGSTGTGSLSTCGGALEAGATRLISGSYATDNRFEFRSRVNF